VDSKGKPAWELRPLSFAELIDTSFRLLRDHFTLLFPIALVFWIPEGLLIAWSGGSVPSKDPLRLYAYLRDPILYLLLETALVDLGFGRTVRLREVCRAAREIMFLLPCNLPAQNDSVP